MINPFGKLKRHEKSTDLLFRLNYFWVMRSIRYVEIGFIKLLKITVKTS